MEPWSYTNGGKGFVSRDSVSANGGISCSKNGLMGSELMSTWSYGGTMVFSSQEGVGNQEFVELGTSDMMSKYLANDSLGDVLSSRISNGREISPFTSPLNAFSGEDESSSKLSSSIVESNCRDASLIDLKLGRLNDHKDAKNFSSFEATGNLTSAEIWIPSKRARARGLSSQTPYCQVHGCKKDLSCSKDYHKRHKVCEIHSKTAKVIVRGIEQRFCQQCSRFHVLAEFDDGKRSCRKRLAGHNERRRKPHMRIHDDRAGRLFQSFNATRFPGNAFSASSFVCKDILPSSLLDCERYETNDSYGVVKVEDGVNPSSYLSNPFTNGLVQPKSLFSSRNSEKQCPSFQDDGISTISSSGKINQNSFCMQDMEDPDIVTHSRFHNSSIRNEDMTVLDSSSTIQGLLESHSGCALSLLSSQSQNSTNHSIRGPAALPLITSGRRALYPTTPEKLFRVNTQSGSALISTTSHSSLMSSSGENQLDPTLISAGSDTVNGGIDRIIQGSEYMNSNNSFSCDGPTINLLQLSSQLQHVEHQRQSMLMKQENDAFSDLRIT